MEEASTASGLSKPWLDRAKETGLRQVQLWTQEQNGSVMTVWVGARMARQPGKVAWGRS